MIMRRMVLLALIGLGLVTLQAATLQLQEGAASYAGCIDTSLDMAAPLTNYDALPGLWLYDYESAG